MPRRPTSTAPRNIRRRQRYWQLKEAGLSVEECELASAHPQRYAEAMRGLGLEPTPELERLVLGGRPRLNTAKSVLSTRLYHDLRSRGAVATFASQYCKSETTHARGVRILNGEESE